MARQEDGCWRCGAQWAYEEVPRTALKVIAGGRLGRPAADGWMNEAGSVDSQVAVAVAAGR